MKVKMIDPALVALAVKLVDDLDAEYEANGDSERYHMLRDALFDFADKSEAHASLVRDVIPV